MEFRYDLLITKQLDAGGLRPLVAMGMEHVVVAVAQRAKAAMPRRFAPLLRAIVEDRGPGREIIGIIALPKSRKGQNTFLARFAETGTDPHDIVASRRGRRFLRFEVEGRVVFTRRVHHPGMPARPWLQPALEESDIERIMLSAIRGADPGPVRTDAREEAAR